MGNEHSKDLFGGKDESQLSKAQALDLHSKHIRNVKGIRLSLFTSLVSLNLSLNELENVSGIEELQSTLEELDLSSNPLKATEPIFQLWKLKVLNLERTSITELSTNIGCLSLLVSLNCSYNTIKELPKQIEACKQLTKLMLNKNELRVLPKEIGNLPSLELLNLADNFLGELPPEIGLLYNLKKLYVDHNELLELPSQLSKLTKLRELNIRCNQLAALPHAIGHLTNLQLLDLEDNEFNSTEYKTDDLPAFLSWLVNQQTPVKRLRTRRTRTRLSVDERTDASLKAFHSNKKSTASPFRFVSNKNSLYIVKGKNRIYIRQKEVSYKSLNEGDVFILETPKNVFVWMGKQSNKRERMKAQYFATQLSAAAHTELVVIDSATKSSRMKEFWSALGGKGSIASAKEGGSDAEFELINRLSTKLFRISETSGRIDVMAWVGQEVTKDLLDSSAAFILDCQSMIFVWAGMYSSMSERSWAMLKAEELQSNALSGAPTVLWVVDGEEMLLFKDQFDDWQDIAWDEEEHADEEQQAEFLHPEPTKQLTRVRSNSTSDIKPIAEEAATTPATAATAATSASLKNEGLLLRKYGSEWKELYFVLRGGYLHVYKNEKSRKLKEEIEQLSLKGSSFVEEEDPLCFTLHSPTLAITLKAATLDEVVKWSNSILREQLLFDDPTLTTSTSSAAPSVPVPATLNAAPATMSTSAVDLTKQFLHAYKLKEKEKELQKAKRLSTPNAALKLSVPKPEPVPVPVPSITVQPPQHAHSEPVLIKEQQAEGASDKVCPSCGRRGVRASSKFCQQCGSQLIAAPAKLTGPSKAAVTGRRAPTSNPVRNRAAVAHESELNRKEQSAASTTGRQLGVGGFGILYAVGADQHFDALKRASGAAVEKSNITEYDPHQPRLIQVKGRRNIFVKLVELSAASLNEADVFLLDPGKKSNVLFQWNGSEANRIVKGKAMDVAKSIKDKERSGIPRVVVLDAHNSEKEEEFWKILGPKSQVQSAVVSGDDVSAERNFWSNVKLHQLCYEDENNQPLDNFELSEVASSKLYKEMLDERQCYILDCVTEVYVWPGKKAPSKVKTAVLNTARQILASREFWTAPLVRELPGAETVLFKERFANWGSGIPIQMQQIRSGVNVAKSVQQQKIDVHRLYEPRPEAEGIKIDDGSGTYTIWRVEDNKKIAIDASHYGEFYSGESYLIHYSYTFKNKEAHIIYFWQGRNSTILEKGTSAMLTVELDDSLGRSAKEIRVVQNKEPKHFFLVFKDRFFVRLGKEKQERSKSCELFQIYGTKSWNIHAIEVNAVATSLNTNSVFLLKSETELYLWIGKCSSPEEQTFAKNIPTLSKNLSFTEIEEGKEPDAFWQLLDGKGSYPLCLTQSRVTARLFECSIGTGSFTVEEITPFTQDDLCVEDVYILDAYDVVFIWVGKLSDEKEKTMAMSTAVEYVTEATDGRDKAACAIWVVLQGQEPLSFTTHFHGWDWSKYSNNYTPALDATVSVHEILAQYNRKYTYAELKSKNYPKGLDASKLEVYLADDEFESVFSCSREQFNSFPLWKQQKLKRSLGLF